MSSLKAGQALRGAKDTYFILKQINETIWTARHEPLLVLVL
jgi:hypothetical protein